MTNLHQIANKITAVLFVQQALASAAFIAIATLNSLVAQHLTGHSAAAGVPSAVYLLAGALAAWPWGVANSRFGRRPTLVLALLFGAVGGGIASVAVAQGNFPIFLAAMLLMGIANSEVLLARFAAADVNEPAHRGRAISYVVFGGTVGSVLGPFLAGPAGAFLLPYTGEQLAGAYAVGGLLFALASFVVFIWLRPEPREVARQFNGAGALMPMQALPAAGSARSTRQVLNDPAVRVAMSAMLLGQLVMVAVMVITALHMKDHGHMLTDIAAVTASHTFGMYAFSVISGQLADRWGRTAIISLGAAGLVLACLAAPFSPDVLPLGFALFLLGLGWNFTYVGGSALLADNLAPAERDRFQGFNDLLVGLASAAGSLLSGMVFAAWGFSIMAYMSAMVALVPLLMSARKKAFRPA